MLRSAPVAEPRSAAVHRGGAGGPRLAKAATVKFPLRQEPDVGFGVQMRARCHHPARPAGVMIDCVQPNGRRQQCRRRLY
jgi:hypothetical protein